MHQRNHECRSFYVRKSNGNRFILLKYCWNAHNEDFGHHSWNRLYFPVFFLRCIFLLVKSLVEFLRVEPAKVLFGRNEAGVADICRRAGKSLRVVIIYYSSVTPPSPTLSPWISYFEFLIDFRSVSCKWHFHDGSKEIFCWFAVERAG